jgi:putative DNA methylase
VTEIKRKKKLIEVALPLDEINAASKADKGRAHGTLKNLHKWFAPMPVPAWRALLFAALVDDPEDDNRRVYLLDVIKRLVANGADLPDNETLAEARRILAAQFPEGLPMVHDPFCGGGSTLVEAQRLGLETLASDLNPVPVLITRTLTQLLPKITGLQPIHPESRKAGTALSFDDEMGKYSPKTYVGIEGLTCDVLHYAGQIRDAARQRLSNYYPASTGETVVAWLWGRTATCPNPTCGVDTVLTTTWWLSKRKNDMAWIEPRIENGVVELDVITGQRSGEAPAAPKSPRGASFQCLGCLNPLPEDVLESQAEECGLGLRMTAIVVEKEGGRRTYRKPTQAEIDCATVSVEDYDVPETVPVSDGGSRNRFGLNMQSDLYTSRQLATMSVLATLVAETYDRVVRDGGTLEWASAVTSMLGLGVGRFAQFASSQARWTVRSNVSSFEGAFPRNDIPMTWDFYEINPFGDAGPSWTQTFISTTRALRNVVSDGRGVAVIGDARRVVTPRPALVATDPPYFDAIGYADLSDYFYVWHRRALKRVHPDLYTTMAAPKQGELTAIAAHHGNDRQMARNYFIDGFTDTFRNLQASLAPGLPMIVVYASREQKGGNDEQTRWSSILTSIVNADMEITGTWPILGTTDRRMVGQGSNVVATYIAMTCRPRLSEAQTTSLADFNRALRRELAVSIRDLQAASILPVDLAQAAMGPGMQIYSRYRSVLDQSGHPVPVEHALRLINAALGEVLDEQEGELDPDSRFAVRWWETYGWTAAPFGEADKTARPLGISADDVLRAKVAESIGGKVFLLGSGELDNQWVPSADIRPTAWEAVHHLAHRLIDKGGELEAARLMAVLGNLQDPAMALVYRLHDIAANKGRTGDQERYNALINSWAELMKLSSDGSTAVEELF